MECILHVCGGRSWSKRALLRVTGALRPGPPAPCASLARRGCPTDSNFLSSPALLHLHGPLCALSLYFSSQRPLQVPLPPPPQVYLCANSHGTPHRPPPCPAADSRQLGRHAGCTECVIAAFAATHPPAADAAATRRGLTPSPRRRLSLTPAPQAVALPACAADYSSLQPPTYTITLSFDIGGVTTTPAPCNISSCLPQVCHAAH